MFQDFVLNGEAHGDVAQQLMGMRWDPGLRRPYVETDRDSKYYGQKVVERLTGKTVQNAQGLWVPERVKTPVSEVVRNFDVDHTVYNATGLRKEEWRMLDDIVIRETRQRLGAWADLAAANSFGGFNGMSKMVLEHEVMDDPGEAIVDMDGITTGRTDMPTFQLRGLPLPITHSDYWFSSRKLAISRNSGTPLDSTMAEVAVRRVLEMVERTLIGVETGITYGGNDGGPTYDQTSKVYGYTNHPDRNTYTSLTTPTGTNPQDTVDDVLAMLDVMYADGYFGPFMLYYSNDWSRYMNNDYVFSQGSNYGVNPTMTLKERLMKIDGISDCKRLDFWTPVNSSGASLPFQLLLVQMTSDVARAVNGMDITTVQWESKGGMALHFKVMCIYVPQIRSTKSGKSGVLHASTTAV